MGGQEKEETQRDLPLAPMVRLIRKAGGGRASRSATVVLAEVLEEEGRKIAVEAQALALHAGRKTVNATDVRLAAKNVLQVWRLEGPMVHR